MSTDFLDWITAVVPCFHPNPIEGGRIMKVSPDGVIEWQTATRLEVEGSHESNILVRTHDVNLDRQGVMLEVTGNPTKWLQGHNVFGGFCSPSALMDALIEHLSRVVPGIQPSDFDRRKVQDGRFKLLRVDVTRMYELDSRAAVRAWLRSSERSAYMKHRGRGTLTKNGTLYFGKHSRRWSLKFYAKGDELDGGKGHSLPEGLECADRLSAWAGNKLRCELVLRSMELKRRGLEWGMNWSDATAAELMNGIVLGLQMSDKLTLPASALEGLPPRLRAFYEAWVNGVDLREILPKNTFYRYRRQLLPLGVDLAIRQPSEDRSNVVPLIRVLEAVPVGPPEWAKGTSLLAEPGRVIWLDRKKRA